MFLAIRIKWKDHFRRFYDSFIDKMFFIIQIFLRVLALTPCIFYPASMGIGRNRSTFLGIMFKEKACISFLEYRRQTCDVCNPSHADHPRSQ